MRAWVVRAGENGERERAALDKGLLLAGWLGLGDLSDTATRDDIRAAVAAAYPDEGPYTVGNWTGQLYRFVHEIQPGDFVVLPLKSWLVAVGRVTGDYEYRSEAADGMHHVRRVEWLVTDIDRQTIQSDLLDSMGSLLTVFELSRFGAAERVAALAEGKPDPGRPDADEFAATLTEPAKLYEEVRRRDADQPLTLSIRDFLAVWGVQRRYPAATEQIKSDLADRGLVTVPPFTEGTLDSQIVVLAGGAEPDESGTSTVTRLSATLSGSTGLVASVLDAAHAVGHLLAEEAEPQTVAYRVSNLDSANRMPESVRVGDSLHTAMTIMVLRGYSQLPVLDADGRLRGVVSWESIGRARMADPGADLQAATVRGQEADRSDDLLDWIGTIQQSGYVLVRDHDHKICGLITAADLTVQFGTRVRPFVLVEEIEQRLRRVVDRCIPLDRIRAVVPRGRAARVNSAANLTFGAYGHLLRVPENWAALGWSIDQQYFLTALEDCRNFRNSLMHFSPDPVTEEQLLPAQGLLELLRSVDPQI
ncbi:CBS domain-containing protein [Streptomyces ipomoeae]|uniref:CBS domain-containing protein n=1 Tax=Streptomyces ipomoeae TaxID=103232 RepID=UPI0015F0C39F|nr:CBS domain-containing protein [Streptomyces ipomoeae]MDX2936498.1 CBS domain-containing protein [Streptomyces ipomoeae]